MTKSSKRSPHSLRTVIDAVVGRPGFEDALPSLAEETGASPAQTLQGVRRCLAEFVSIPSDVFRKVAAQISQSMTSLGYETPAICDPTQLEQLRSLMAEHPVALLWSHKSHVDGTAVIATLHAQGFPMLHSFGGINMAFAGVGYAGRRSGIIFIRRKFNDDPLYKFALRQYLGYLMEQRAPFSWSFEGTRSRIGKLMPPRLGLLKYLVEAAASTGTEGVRLVPVSVSYDLISDVDDYAVEETGRKKQAESLGWFVGYLKRLRKPMGRIYLNFGDPVVVAASAAVANRDNDLYKLAFQVAVNANRVTPITLPALISMVLLGALPRAITAGELSDRVMALVHWAQSRNIPLTSSYDLADRERLESVMEMMIQRKLLIRFDRGLDIVYSIGDSEHSIAGYYRNTAIHFFVTKAIVELSLMGLVGGSHTDPVEAFFDRCRWLRNLFKHEFYFSPSAAFQEEIVAELQQLNANWQQAIQGGDLGIQGLISSAQPLVAHSTLLDFLDAYLIMARLLERADQQIERSKAQWVDMALQYGHQAYLQRTITSDAAVGRQILDNAYRWFDGAKHTANTDEARARLQHTRENIEDAIKRAEQLAALARTAGPAQPPV